MQAVRLVKHPDTCTCIEREEEPNPPYATFLLGLFVIDTRKISFSEAIWCTNSGAAKWLLDTGLALNDQGFIEVRKWLIRVSFFVQLFPRREANHFVLVLTSVVSEEKHPLLSG